MKPKSQPVKFLASAALFLAALAALLPRTVAAENTNAALLPRTVAAENTNAALLPRTVAAENANAALLPRTSAPSPAATEAAPEAAFADAPDDALFGWYLGGFGAITLPQGGSVTMRRLGGGGLRLGYYFDDTFAVEAEGAWLEDKAALAAKALYHLQGFDLVNRFFGYERFDPFITGGVRGWIDNGQVGPSLGLGAVYYLTNEWSLRADADFTLGVRGAAEMVYSLSAGVQYSF